MIKLLLCGEGPADVGETHIWDSKRNQFTRTEGWLQGLLRKILVNDAYFDSRSRRQVTLLPRETNRYRPLPPGHGAKALFARIIATNENFDAVVFMADADSRYTSDWKHKRNEIIAGFEGFGVGVIAIACVPKATSESWLLSDSGAWRKCGLADTSVLPARPEESWGVRSDPNGRHPHQEFARACERAGIEDSRETRVILAEGSSVSTLRDKCPLSFATFSDDVSDAFGEAAGRL